MYIETEIVSTKEISLSEFIQDVSTNEKYVVDINSLLGVCGASPLRVHYETDRVDVNEFFPTKILLWSGKNYVSIEMITKIIKIEDNLGVISYEIHCGSLVELTAKVVITQA